MYRLLAIEMPVTKEELEVVLDQGPMTIEEIYGELNGDYTLGEVYRATQQLSKSGSISYDDETEEYELV